MTIINSGNSSTNFKAGTDIDGVLKFATKEGLPSSAARNELIVTSDTHEFFKGNGVGNALTQLKVGGGVKLPPYKGLTKPSDDKRPILWEYDIIVADGSHSYFFNWDYDEETAEIPFTHSLEFKDFVSSKGSLNMRLFYLGYVWDDEPVLEEDPYISESKKYARTGHGKWDFRTSDRDDSPGIIFQKGVLGETRFKMVMYDSNAVQ